MVSCSPRRWLVVSVLSALVAGALVAVLVLQPWGDHEPQVSRYPRAAVAANGVECAAIGREILEKNGSAVDAAIATLLCEGAGCAQCMGLGGGFLAVIYNATTGEVRVLNARERAPAASTLNMFANVSSTVGGLAIAVPGELRGYGELHRMYGSLPWRELVQPAAKLCKKGHIVTEYMGRILASNAERIKNEPSMSEVYVNPTTGNVYAEGDLLPLPTLARTLDIIAEEGPEAIHNGSLTAQLARDIASFGGIVTEDDLRNYKVEWQEPVAVPLTEGHTLYSVPLPGSGAVLAFILNMLRGWVGPGTEAPIDSSLYWHRIIEAFKYAYAKRTGLGDPSRSDMSDLPFDINELHRNLTSQVWAQSFRALVDDHQTSNDWRHYGALYEGADDHGTAQVVVMAPDGSAVAVTSTVNYIWGSLRRSQSLGIILNNEMDDFAIPHHNSVYGMAPSPSNMLAPGLQPLSSMTPTILLSRDVDNKMSNVDLVIGAAGGTKITTQIALAIMHFVFEKEDLPTLMNRPRLHHQLMPMEIQHEKDFDKNILVDLQNRGHAITELGATAGFAAIVGASRDSSGMLTPRTDKRRPGSSDGF